MKEKATKFEALQAKYLNLEEVDVQLHGYSCMVISCLFKFCVVYKMYIGNRLGTSVTNLVTLCLSLLSVSLKSNCEPHPCPQEVYNSCCRTTVVPLGAKGFSHTQLSL